MLGAIKGKKNVKKRSSSPIRRPAAQEVESGHPKKSPGVAFVDLLPIHVRDIEVVDVPDRLADVERPFLGIEREIAGEDDVVGAEERQAAGHRVASAEERGV